MNPVKTVINTITEQFNHEIARKPPSEWGSFEALNKELLKSLDKDLLTAKEIGEAINSSMEALKGLDAILSHVYYTIPCVIDEINPLVQINLYQIIQQIKDCIVVKFEELENHPTDYLCIPLLKLPYYYLHFDSSTKNYSNLNCNKSYLKTLIEFLEDAYGIEVAQKVMALKHLDLGTSDLSRMIPEKWDIENCQGSLNFQYSKLINTSFRHVTFKGSCFNYAHLENAFISNSNFNGSTFINAKLSECTLSNTDMTDANFNGSIAINSRFSRVSFTKERLDQMRSANNRYFNIETR